MDGAQLKAAREAKGWSLREAAKFLEVDHNTLHHWEQGKATPRGYNRRRIEEVYGISLAPISCVVLPLVTSPPFLSTDLTMCLQAIAFIRFTTFQQVRQKVRHILEEFDAMNANNKDVHITRRDALSRVAALPFLALNLSSAHSEDILSQCATSIAACWELSKSKASTDLALAFESASFNLHLLDIVLHTGNSSHRKHAAGLAALTAMIKTILGWSLEGAHDTIHYAKQAIEYSQQTDDILMQINAYKYLAWAHNYDDGQDKKALNAIHQAILLLKQHGTEVPGVVQGDVYSALAYIQSKNHQSGIASLKIAEKALSYNDESIYCSDDSLPLLRIHIMMTLYASGDYGQAQNIAKDLIDFDSLKMKVPLSERNRLIIINTISEAMLKHPQRDMQQSIHFWQAGIEGARALQSEQRFREAVTNYTILSALWHNEERITRLRNLISHW